MRKKQEIPHGTKGGYVTHKRRTEVPCYECRTAWRDYYRVYRTTKAAEAGVNVDTSNQ